MNDRARIIAAMIDYLVAHHAAQPDLAALAHRAGYDPAHFQKLFTAYAGVSPKRMIQYMNMRRARGRLESGGGVLDSALAAGLSGGGRLHDLCISCEGVTPGDVQRRGAGVDIVYGFHPTPLGEVMIGRTPRGICWLGFLMAESRDESCRRMKAFWPLARFAHDDAAIREAGAAVAALWSPEKTGGLTLRLDLYGTNFQIQVWQALLRIPMGDTRTYRDIAQQVGRPKASRAVGNAVGANPVSLLIPCHRVIRASGIIDNYGWGSARKKLILGAEGCLGGASDRSEP